MKVFRRLLLLLLVVLVVANCDQVDFTAPAGSTLTITIQPPSVATFGNANITVVGTRGNGAPLPDETVIHFTTNLGTISPNPAETDNGIATAQFRSGSRSGTATITATSGGNEEATVEVVIGEARPANVILIANPSTLPFGGGTVTLKAHVTDADGNPLAGIAVFFETTTGELRSGGSTVRTNDAGIATDTLETTIDASVTATTGNGISSEAREIDVAPGEGPDCDFVFSPPDPQPGETVTFSSLATGTGGPGIAQFLWDFGDGESAEGQTVTHEFELAGSYTVVHTVIDEFGASSICTEVVEVQIDEPDCTFTAEPDAPLEGENVFFDASESSSDSGIDTFEWSFGDGTPTVVETDPFTNHVYNFPGCSGSATESVQVSLIVTDNEGNQSFCSLTLTIDCN
jgi:PKD repeat protein